MINRLVIISAFMAFIPASGFAQTVQSWLPESGAKSPYSPLAVPTTLHPEPNSLADLLNTGYRITTTTDYAGSGALFTLVRHSQTILCILSAPTPSTDQNIPISRCWSLNNPALHTPTK